MRICVLGATGQVGYEVLRLLETDKRHEVLALARSQPAGLKVPFQQIDLGESSYKPLENFKPDVLVNAAAYTQVDRAETEKEQCFHLNARVPEELGHLCKKMGTKLVHFSTDYVYGPSKDPLTEDSLLNPLNVYGKTKRDGDELLLNTGCEAIILRISWIYSYRGKNFYLTMRRLGKEKDQLSVVGDQVGSPTSAIFVAEHVLGLLSQPKVAGIYNLCTEGATSWADFAQKIFEVHQLSTRVIPITSNEYPTPAKRLLNSRMSCARYDQEIAQSRISWQDDLARISELSADV